MNSYRTGLILLMAMLLTGCNNGGVNSSRGFSLPEGNAEDGKVVFAELNCHACHTVVGEAFDIAKVESPMMDVPLGGEVTRVKTYGELVTSIINPSHRLATGNASKGAANEGQSSMPIYNDTMTVHQLIDLVAFLKSKYKLERYDPSEYPVYMYETGSIPKRR